MRQGNRVIDTSVLSVLHYHAMGMVCCKAAIYYASQYKTYFRSIAHKHMRIVNIGLFRDHNIIRISEQDSYLPMYATGDLSSIVCCLCMGAAQ